MAHERGCRLRGRIAPPSRRGIAGVNQRNNFHILNRHNCPDTGTAKGTAQGWSARSKQARRYRFAGYGAL